MLPRDGEHVVNCRERGMWCVVYSVCRWIYAQAGGRAGTLHVSLCSDVIELYAFLTRRHACHVEYMCECILHLHHPRLGDQYTGSTQMPAVRGGRRALATRLAPRGVCCHFSEQGAKGEDSRREQALFSLCVR